MVAIIKRNIMLSLIFTLMITLNFSIALTAFYEEEIGIIEDGEEPGTSWCCCYKGNETDTYSSEISFYYDDAMSPFFESSAAIQYRSSIKDAISLIFLGDDPHDCDGQCRKAKGQQWTSCGNISPCVRVENMSWPNDPRCDKRCYQEGGGYDLKQCSKGNPDR